MYTDGYENFGWILDGSANSPAKVDSVTLKFKRDRKIPNKAELTRLQKQFDSTFSEIISLEISKNVKASVVAYIIGIIGTAFMAGSVFAVTSNLIPLCVVLAIPGFIGWALPILFYRNILLKKTSEVIAIPQSIYSKSQA